MNQLIPVDDKKLKRAMRSISDLEGSVAFLKFMTVITLIVGLVGWWF